MFCKLVFAAALAATAIPAYAQGWTQWSGSIRRGTDLPFAERTKLLTAPAIV